MKPYNKYLFEAAPKKSNGKLASLWKRLMSVADKELKDKDGMPNKKNSKYVLFLLGTLTSQYKKAE